MNPTQFAPTEDLEQYPRPLEKDLELLAAEGVDAVFLPTNATMYPAGYSTLVQPPEVSKRLEGEFRPTHFQGVATIVLKLLNVIPAERAYFGQKDYQQTLVVKKMVEDLNVPTTIEVCPIVRSEDGLALSSRNVYLSESGRKRAISISAGIEKARKLIESGEKQVSRIVEVIRQTLASAQPESIDYVKIVSADDLSEIDTIERDVVILVAAFFDKTRLIDNAFVKLTQ